MQQNLLKREMISGSHNPADDLPFKTALVGSRGFNETFQNGTR